MNVVHYGWRLLQIKHINLLGNITSGFPTVSLPPFSYEEDGHEYNFTDMLSKLNSALIIIPIIAILENVAIAKAFGE